MIENIVGDRDLPKGLPPTGSELLLYSKDTVNKCLCVRHAAHVLIDRCQTQLSSGRQHAATNKRDPQPNTRQSQRNPEKEGEDGL